MQKKEKRLRSKGVNVEPKRKTNAEFAGHQLIMMHGVQKRGEGNLEPAAAIVGQLQQFMYDGTELANN